MFRGWNNILDALFIFQTWCFITHFASIRRQLFFLSEGDFSIILQLSHCAVQTSFGLVLFEENLAHHRGKKCTTVVLPDLIIPLAFAYIILFEFPPLSIRGGEETQEENQQGQRALKLLCLYRRPTGD